MLSWFDQGGWVMYPILACSVTSWAVIFERTWHFVRLRFPSIRRKRYLVLDRAAEDQGCGDRAQIDRALRVAAAPFLRADGRGLTLLAAVATCGPLLGLFGTVLGMIQLFQGLEAAGTNPAFSQLVGGIWTALLTTAFGMATAIPAHLAHQGFDHLAEAEARSLETYADQKGLGK